MCWEPLTTEDLTVDAATIVPDGVVAMGTLNFAGVKTEYQPPGYEWTGGFARSGARSGAVYVRTRFKLTTGEYAGAHFWFNIGLHSNKGPEYRKMGRALIFKIVNAAIPLRRGDKSDEAMAERNDFFDGDFMGLQDLEIPVKVRTKKSDFQESGWESTIDPLALGDPDRKLAAHGFTPPEKQSEVAAKPPSKTLASQPLHDEDIPF